MHIVRTMGFIASPVISITIPLVLLLIKMLILYFEILKLPDERVVLVLLVVQDDVLPRSIVVVKI